VSDGRTICATWPRSRIPAELADELLPTFFKVLVSWYRMTLDELEREYVTLRQQADAVRSYL